MPSGDVQLDLPHRLADERLAHRDPRKPVTSRALETWPGTSSPSGLTKCVSVRPSSRARAFISGRNAATLPPPTCAASAFAASFALGSGRRGGDRRRSPSPRPGGGSSTRRPRRRRSAPSRLRGPCMLERDERRHQLRDRRDRHPLASVELRNIAVGGVLDEVGLGVDRGREAAAAPVRSATRERERGVRSASRRRALYSARMRSPIPSATGSTSGFRIRSASTVV